ncbi:MAG TPA: site-specific integrase [Candidatus Dormibacteraeota bacterium]|jgi:integrase|nr:site-specific integrase [Candidatus Dormibacteraeota bacterium]
MSRRTDGEGTVYELKPGCWRAQRYIAGARFSAYGATARIARGKLAEKVKAHEAGVRVSGQPQKFGDYLDTWLSETKNSLKPSAYLRNEYAVRLHIKPQLGQLRLSELSRGDLTSFYAGLRAGTWTGRPLSDTSIHHVHATIRAALSVAVLTSRVAVNIAAGYPAPRMTHRPKVLLDKAELTRLVAAAEGDPLEALWVLLATTGMRQGEARGLYWDTVDLSLGRLRIRQTATLDYDGVSMDADGFVYLGVPKTSSGRRTITLSQVALRALRRHWEAAGKPTHGPVFVSPHTGRALGATGLLRNYFHPLLKRAGLPPMPLHDLRHSVATLLLLDKVPAHAVSDLLGHASVQVTLGIYAGVTDELRSDVAAAAGRWLEAG